MMFGQSSCIKTQGAGALDQDILKRAEIGSFPAGHNRRQGAVGGRRLFIGQFIGHLDDTGARREVTILGKSPTKWG